MDSKIWLAKPVSRTFLLASVIDNTPTKLSQDVGGFVLSLRHLVSLSDTMIRSHLTLLSSCQVIWFCTYSVSISPSHFHSYHPNQVLKSSILDNYKMSLLFAWVIGAYSTNLNSMYILLSFCHKTNNIYKLRYWSFKAMAPHSSTLAWKIPWMEEPGRLQSMRSLRVRHDWATSLSVFTFMHWRRKWQPTPVFLPGESQARGSLVGCRLWGRTESDTTEVT